MLSPCELLRGLSNAPVGAKRTRRHRFSRSPPSRKPFSTAAEQPQPLPLPKRKSNNKKKILTLQKKSK